MTVNLIERLTLHELLYLEADRVGQPLHIIVETAEMVLDAGMSEDTMREHLIRKLSPPMQR